MRKADRQVTKRLCKLALQTVRIGWHDYRLFNVLGDLSCFVSLLPQSKSRLCALTLNNDVTGLDGDLDPRRDLEQFLGVAVAQLSAHVHAIQSFSLVRCPAKSRAVPRNR